MCGYSQVNGQFDCQNNYLLNTLDQRWGYPGFVSSDYGATHSTAASANAGLDQDMPGTGGYYGAALAAAVQAASVTVPISLTATDGGRSYLLNPVTLTVSVPYPSAGAAYDDVGITSDSATGAGAFDGGGDSYSEQALTAAGRPTVDAAGLDQK